MKNQPSIEACRNFRFRNTPETLRYFYHPDHIGSTSWVTDSAKNGIQYCEYLPFGEPFLDQRSTTWNSRYTFSGKERDGETGYSYFGARYYNSDISIWLSVDPMADKYPNLTPYAYCGNNPIVLVDPDGRDVEESEDWVRGKDGRYRYDSRVHSQKDAEKYYGEESQAIANGYYYKSNQGIVKLLDNGVFVLNGVKKQVQDQATGLSKMVAIIKNAIYQLDQDGSGDPANDGDPWINEKVGPILQGLVLLNPIVGIPNDVKTLVTGEDIYDNKASTIDKVVSVVDMFTFGGASATKYVGKGVAKVMDYINKLTTGYSVGKTINDESKKN